MKDIAAFEVSVAQKFRPWFIKNIELHQQSTCLRSALERHPQFLCIMNHGGFYGPWAAALAFHYLYLTHGGEQRKPTGVAWRGFYKLPVYKQVTEYLTQLKSPLNYQHCLKLLKDNTFQDMIILPEGTNCHYFNGKELQPFISPRFIELSIETQTPLLLFIHQGSEHWSIPVKIPDRLMPITRLLPKRYQQGLKRSRLVNIPHMLKGSIPKLSVTCRLYQPAIHPSALRDKAFSKQLIEQEAHKIRAIMQQDYDVLIGARRNEVNANQALEFTHPCVEVA